VIAVATGLDGNALFEALTTASSPLFGVTVVAVLLAAGVAMVVLLRRRWLGRGTVRQAGTWDCGYIRPAPRMQYTASSFVWPLMALFGGVVRSRRRFAMDPGLFPAQGQLDTDPRDVFRDRVFFPLFRLVEYWLSFVKWLQAGRVQWYVLYIVLTLFVLLFWVLKVQE
jgi:hydrogenase-4 component B